MSAGIKEIHDKLLASKPDGADHESDNCALCKLEAASEEDEVSAEKIYDQEQHDSLIQAAVDQAVAAAKKESDAEILQLNEKLTEKETELASVQERVEAFEAETVAREEAERLATLGTERVGQIKEVASFTDEQLAARQERWAKMDETEFAALVDEYKLIAPPVKEKPVENVKVETSTFDGTRSTAGEDETEYGALKELFGSSKLVDAASRGV